MKRLILIIPILLCGIGNMFAADDYDFEVDGIYYKVLSLDDMSVEATYSTTDGNLYDVVVPPTVTYKDRQFTVKRMFVNVSQTTILNSLTIPCTVDKIGHLWEGFKEIVITDADAPLYIDNYFHSDKLQILYIGRNITTGNGSPFMFAGNLSSVVLGSHVTKIDDYLFGFCEQIKSIIIPNSVKNIGHYAFRKCHNLATIYLGENIDSIGECVFQDCENLKVINCQCQIPPRKYYMYSHNTSEDYEPFDKNTYMEATLRIPRGTLEAYKSADCWKKFWNIEEVDSFDIPSQDILPKDNDKTKKKGGKLKRLANSLKAITNM